jgi:hypothetical protein
MICSTQTKVLLIPKSKPAAIKTKIENFSKKRLSQRCPNSRETWVGHIGRADLPRIFFFGISIYDFWRVKKKIFFPTYFTGRLRRKTRWSYLNNPRKLSGGLWKFGLSICDFTVTPRILTTGNDLPGHYKKLQNLRDNLSSEVLGRSKSFFVKVY